MATCSACDGKGKVKNLNEMETDGESYFNELYWTCSVCDGTGCAPDDDGLDGDSERGESMVLTACMGDRGCNCAKCIEVRIEVANDEEWADLDPIYREAEVWRRRTFSEE